MKHFIESSFFLSHLSPAYVQNVRGVALVGTEGSLVEDVTAPVFRRENGLLVRYHIVVGVGRGAALCRVRVVTSAHV